MSTVTKNIFGGIALVGGCLILFATLFGLGYKIGLARGFEQGWRESETAQCNQRTGDEYPKTATMHGRCVEGVLYIEAK